MLLCKLSFESQHMHNGKIPFFPEIAFFFSLRIIEKMRETSDDLRESALAVAIQTLPEFPPLHIRVSESLWHVIDEVSQLQPIDGPAPL